MKIPKEVMQKRREVAADLEKLVNILHVEVFEDITPITDSIKKLKDDNEVFKNPTLNQKRDKDIWGYEIQNLSTKIQNPRHLMPSDLYGLSLDLSVSAYGKIGDKRKVQDPFIYLGIVMVIYGKRNIGDDIVQSVSSFHLDKDEEKNTNEPHPMYHFQFGGTRIRELKKDNNSFGQLMNMDVPRISHYPMDFILAVDFMLSNFKTELWKSMIKDGNYAGLIRKKQKAYIRPYAHALSNKWGTNKLNVEWDSQTIIPQLQ